MQKQPATNQELRELSIIGPNWAVRYQEEFQACVNVMTSVFFVKRQQTAGFIFPLAHMGEAFSTTCYEKKCLQRGQKNRKPLMWERTEVWDIIYPGKVSKLNISTQWCCSKQLSNIVWCFLICCASYIMYVCVYLHIGCTSPHGG